MWRIPGQCGYWERNSRVWAGDGVQGSKKLDYSVADSKAAYHFSFISRIDPCFVLHRGLGRNITILCIILNKHSYFWLDIPLKLNLYNEYTCGALNPVVFSSRITLSPVHAKTILCLSYVQGNLQSSMSTFLRVRS